jgi:hypothetical protein
MGKRIRLSSEKMVLKRRELDNCCFFVNLVLKIGKIKVLESDKMNEQRPGAQPLPLTTGVGQPVKPTTCKAEGGWVGRTTYIHKATSQQTP